MKAVLTKSHLTTPAVDSFSVYINWQNVKVLDLSLDQHYMKSYSVNGQLLTSGELHSPEPYKFVFHGTTYRMQKTVQRFGNVADSYLHIVITAKMIGARYFDGITSETLRIAYDNLMQLKIVQFSYSDLLAATPTDIDICANALFPFNGYKQAISYTWRTMTDGKRSLCHTFDNMGNVGIKFNDRRKATTASPHLKIYHKGNELRSKRNAEFFARFFDQIPPATLDQLIRYEYTIKNAKFKRHHKLSLSTVRDLLNFADDNETMERVLLSGLDKYTAPRVRVVSDVTPVNTAIANLISLAHDLGATPQQLACFYDWVPDSDPHKKKKEARLYNRFCLASALIPKDEHDLAAQALREATRNAADEVLNWLGHPHSMFGR